MENTKSALKSKGVIGGVAGIIVGVQILLEAFGLSPLGSIDGAIEGGAVILTSLLAAYGRIKANAQIK